MILRLLYSNNELNELTLSNNDLKDNDIVLLKPALKRLTHFKKLNLSNNKITDRGFASLLQVIAESSITIDYLKINNNSIKLNSYSLTLEKLL